MWRAGTSSDPMSVRRISRNRPSQGSARSASRLIQIEFDRIRQEALHGWQSVWRCARGEPQGMTMNVSNSPRDTDLQHEVLVTVVLGLAIAIYLAIGL
jgi:hypothetical protein